MVDQVDLLKIKTEEARGKLPEETKTAIDSVDWKAVILGMRESKGYSFEQLGELETETELLLCGLLSPENYPKELEKRMDITKARADELVNDMNQLVFSRIREEIVKQSERKKIFEHTAKPSTTGVSFASVAQNTNKPQPIQPAGMSVGETSVLHSAGIKIIDEATQVAPISPKPIVAPTPVAPAPSASTTSSGQAAPTKADLSTPELSAPARNASSIADAGGPKPELKAAQVASILGQKLAGTFKIDTTKTEHTTDAPAPTKQNSPNLAGIKAYPKGQDPYRIAPE